MFRMLPSAALRATVCLAFPILAPAQEPEDVQETLDEFLQEMDELEDELELIRSYMAPRDGSPASARLEGYERHREMAAAEGYAQKEWHFLGPNNVSGRVTDVAVATPRGETYRMYAATASGGVWRSDNDGTSWEPIFEDTPTASIGALALDPADEDVLWVGTGEANIFRSSMAGCGVYLTRDGGETWEHKGLEETGTIARLRLHPKDSNTLYVAASGNEWTENEERGVYRTTDGGETWERVLFVTPGCGAIDLVIDPANPERIYAATWERRRKHWHDPRNDDLTSGSGVWRSLDGGDSWQSINTGLPIPAERGRIGIDLCAAQPNVVYAFVDHYGEIEMTGTDSYGRQRRGGIRGATVFRSDDHGEQWTQVSEDDDYMRGLCATYGWVFGQIRVDPVDPERIYVMGLALHVSEDGGKSYRRLRGMHGDHHALWIDPRNPRYLLNGNDGGTAISHDGGENWHTSEPELPAVQFYNLGVSNEEHPRIYGSVQDYGSYVRTVDPSRLRAGPWDRAPGGEASYHAVDPTDPNLLYAESFYGSVFREDLETGERTRFKPEPADGEPALRGQWLAPFLISPHNPRILYHGMNRLYRSLDRGDDIHPISPDLSHADPKKIGDIPYQTISSIAESYQNFGELYVGTDDGRLHRTADSGTTWENIGHGLAKNRWISRVVTSRYEEGVVWVSQNGKRNDDSTAYLWRSVDGGTTWLDRSTGIPLGPINVVVEDPVSEGVFYVGTDVGAYVTTDHGDTWEVLGRLPSNFVHDLKLHEPSGLLFAATHGRGVWGMDVRDLQGRDEAPPQAEPDPDPYEEEEEEEEEEEPEEDEGDSEDGE